MSLFSWIFQDLVWMNYIVLKVFRWVQIEIWLGCPVANVPLYFSFPCHFLVDFSPSFTLVFPPHSVGYSSYWFRNLFKYILRSLTWCFIPSILHVYMAQFKCLWCYCILISGFVLYRLFHVVFFLTHRSLWCYCVVISDQWFVVFALPLYFIVLYLMHCS